MPCVVSARYSLWDISIRDPPMPKAPFHIPIPYREKKPKAVLLPFHDIHQSVHRLVQNNASQFCFQRGYCVTRAAGTKYV